MPSFKVAKQLPVVTATVVDVVDPQAVGPVLIGTVLDADGVSPALADIIGSVEYVRDDGRRIQVGATDRVLDVFAIDAE